MNEFMGWLNSLSYWEFLGLFFIIIGLWYIITSPFNHKGVLEGIEQELKRMNDLKEKENVPHHTRDRSY